MQATPLTADSHVYLVDGSGFIFRAFHALPALSRKSDGLPTGAISGFCNMLFKLIDDATDGDGVGPTHMAVIFDAKGKTFRSGIYPEYKANRPPAPEELVPQFPLIREAVRAFGLPSIELEGYEADDLIAAYTKAARAAGAQVTIVSSDKDLMQLVDDGVSMYDSMKSRIIGPQEVMEKFGVPPQKVIDVQALAGDSTDNIPGAPGIGIKTAALLIEEYGDLETLLGRAGEIKQPKRRQTLIEKAGQIRVSRQLVTLDQDTPLPEPIEDFFIMPPEPAPLIGFFRAMEFTTLTKRAAKKLDADPNAFAPTLALKADNAEAREIIIAPEVSSTGPVAAPPDPRLFAPLDKAKYEIISDMEALDRWIAAGYLAGHIAIDTETTSLDEMRAELVGISLAIELGSAAYIPLAHSTGRDDLFGSEMAEGQLPLESALRALEPLLEDASVLKIGQNLKYDIKVLRRYGIEIAPFDDTMLLSYAQGAGLRQHGMDALSKELLKIEPTPIKSLIGSGRAQITFDKVPIQDAARYAAEDADVTLRLHRLLTPQIIPTRSASVYYTLERPLVPVLADMEMAGVKVDREMLSRLSADFAQRMAGLEDEIYELAGEHFNIASPKQLGDILFNKMGIDAGKKTKTGQLATDAGILEGLAATHELPARVLDWRGMAKLKSTYTDALQEKINPETGRVHTSFSLASTSTGRLASTDPNLQNIPIRTEEGRKIREAFIAEDGHTLISLDYSQIELRILAHLADIAPLKDAFARGEDIHAATASAVFGVPLEDMDPMTRRRAKAINFGVIYGISAHGLALNLRITRTEAKGFIDAYFAQFPGIRAYMETAKEFAREYEYVETLFGRRVHTPNIKARGPQRAYQERAAINAPIQGSAADIIRRAMIRVPKAMAAAGLQGRMLLQVHDELIFEVPEREVERTVEVVKAIMEQAPMPVIELSTPLVVDAGHGKSWGAAH